MFLNRQKKITLPNGSTLQELISTGKRAPGVKYTNHVSLQQESDIVVKPDTADYEYDAETKIDSFTPRGTIQRLLGKTKRTKALSLNAPMKINTPIVKTDQTGTSSTDISSLTDDYISQSSFLEDEVKKIELFTRFDFSPDKTRELQRNDSQLHGLIQYLEYNILPKSQKKS